MSDKELDKFEPDEQMRRSRKRMANKYHYYNVFEGHDVQTWIKTGVTADLVANFNRDYDEIDKIEKENQNLRIENLILKHQIKVMEDDNKRN
ncbi:TPA: hypothetical protein RFV54_003713 [Klebsiella aerogenes]|nr:hypothetical protein [Klebsiella aerogenes]